MPATFSIIIPCFNEQGYIGKLLEDLSRQTVQVKEVIVSDSASEDETLAVVRRYKDKLPLKIVNKAYRSPGGARNAGAEAAAGDYLIFIDADNRLPENTMELLIQATDGGKADFVSPLYQAEGPHWFDRLVVYRINEALARTHKIIGIGCVMVVRKSLHDKIGGFDKLLIKENDMEYLDRLLTLHPVSRVVESLRIPLSSRRFDKDGRVVSLFNFISRKSLIGRKVTYPILRKLGKDKKYGIFTK